MLHPDLHITNADLKHWSNVGETLNIFGVDAFK
jgi:hypothetical protein